MIEITIYERSHHLKASGHALFDQKGRDVVCAAVSVVLQSWMVGTRLLCKQDVSVLQEGDRWEATVDEMNDLAELLWKNMILTLDILSKQYPENIRLHWEENHGS